MQTLECERGGEAVTEEELKFVWRQVGFAVAYALLPIAFVILAVLFPWLFLLERVNIAFKAREVKP